MTIMTIMTILILKNWYFSFVFVFVFQIVFVKNLQCFSIVFDVFPTKNSFNYPLQWFDLTFIKAFNKS